MSAVARSDISEIRKAWKQANLAPLWENARAHRPAPLPDAAYLWSWEKIRPLISAAIDVASPEVVEGRVLQLVPPIAEHQDEQQTSRTLSANIQILLPGEKARPHRHTMSALRFVLEGSGASTIVDGKACPMEEGDLILTPAWTWHEHIHEGAGPIVWLDALDVPFQRYMGTGAFEPGPAADMPETIADAAFAVANVVPDTNYTTKDYLPVFRYPYATAAAAVAVAPPARDGSRRVRYVNPLTGGSGVAMMASWCSSMPTRSRLRSPPPPAQSAAWWKARARARLAATPSDGTSATSSRCRRATGSFTRAAAEWLACSKCQTAICMPGSGCSRKNTGISRPEASTARWSPAV